MLKVVLFFSAFGLATSAAVAAPAVDKPLHVITVDFKGACGSTLAEQRKYENLERKAYREKAKYEKLGYKVIVVEENGFIRQGVFQTGNSVLSDKGRVNRLDFGCR